ncbi:hypothetical protein BH11VER1_BH11VER1_20910 [soil metagenome]
MMPRFLYSLIALLGFAYATSQAVEPKRPKILWLIAEDFGQQLGCYEDKEVTSPNLDRLAAGNAKPKAPTKAKKKE